MGNLTGEAKKRKETLFRRVFAEKTADGKYSTHAKRAASYLSCFADAFHSCLSPRP